MRQSLIVCALLIGWYSIAFSQKNGQYAQDYAKAQKEQYTKVLIDYLENARITYFAVGKVLPSEGSASLVLQSQAEAVDAEAMRDRVID